MTSVPPTEIQFAEDHNNYDYYSFNYPDYYYYNMIYTMDSPPCRQPACIFLTTAEVIIFILGVAGNAVVIWIAGFKVKKSVNITWYLSLAVSDFLFCCILPFEVISKIREDWIFGLFVCKVNHFIAFLSMFSSLFILVIISVDRCVAIMFPVWMQNQRTIRKASVIVTLVWIISAVLSGPALIFQNVHPHYRRQTQDCYYKYMHYQHQTIEGVCHFVFGYLIPFLIIIICFSIIMKINQSARFKKPFKIIMALTVTFFICWLPYHTFTFMMINYTKYDENSFIAVYALGFALASANRCVKPFIYAFMGRDAKIKWYAILSQIENALVEDEDQSREQLLSLQEADI